MFEYGHTLFEEVFEAIFITHFVPEEPVFLGVFLLTSRHPTVSIMHIVNTKLKCHTTYSIHSPKTYYYYLSSHRRIKRERERSFNTVDFHRFLLSQGALRVI